MLSTAPGGFAISDPVSLTVAPLEDLAVRNMVRSHSLARSISDSGWGAFRRMIEYKAERAGRRVIVIDRFYPSSKTCSACGHLLASLSLSTRHWSWSTVSPESKW